MNVWKKFTNAAEICTWALAKQAAEWAGSLVSSSGGGGRRPRGSGGGRGVLAQSGVDDDGVGFSICGSGVQMFYMQPRRPH